MENSLLDNQQIDRYFGMVITQEQTQQQQLKKTKPPVLAVFGFSFGA